MSPRNRVETKDKSPMAEAIQKFRLENGWSQKDMAKAMGISAVIISNMENKTKGRPDILHVLYHNQFKQIGLDLSKLNSVSIVQSSKGKSPKIKDVAIPRQGPPILPTENPAEAARAAIKSALGHYSSLLSKETEARNMHQANIEKLTKEKESIVAMLMEEATKPGTAEEL